MATKAHQFLPLMLGFGGGLGSLVFGLMELVGNGYNYPPPRLVASACVALIGLVWTSSKWFENQRNREERQVQAMALQQVQIDQCARRLNELQEDNKQWRAENERSTREWREQFRLLMTLDKKPQ